MQARNPEINIRGIDVSHYQGDIDWQLVKDSGISFAYLKATEGTYLTDEKLSANIEGAKGADIRIGAYHFLRASTAEDAIAEADYFATTINDMGGWSAFDLPPVVDVEISGNTAEAARAWIDRIKELSRAQPVVYTYPNFIDTIIGDSLADVPLWYANYNVDQPKDRGGWTEWTLLQYADDGEVPGMDGHVDLDEMDINFWKELFEVSGGTNDEPQITEDAANKVIADLGALYEACADEDVKNAAHLAADALRKAAGIEEQ